jgi:DNA-binding PadR family transcriptional regulator
VTSRTDPDLAREFLPLTPATFHILVTLAAGPMHGYAVKREVEERTGGVVRLGAGTLYAGIQRMERDGLIVECDPPTPNTEEAGARWRFYELTGLGREVLDLEVARLESDLRKARSRLRAPETSRA